MAHLYTAPPRRTYWRGFLVEVVRPSLEDLERMRRDAEFRRRDRLGQVDELERTCREIELRARARRPSRSLPSLEVELEPNALPILRLFVLPPRAA